MSLLSDELTENVEIKDPYGACTKIDLAARNDP